jgi:hypothetical protein
VVREPAPENSRAENGSGEVSLQELQDRLRFAEDEKRESEERLLAHVQALEQSCAGLAEAVAEQSRKLEIADRRAQAQEQQLRQQEQRSQQQEHQLLQQEKRLHEQELQIQQQEQQFDEQHLLLREHEQQLEQQEQMLDQHKACINELIATMTSGSSRNSGIVAEDQALRALPAEAPPRLATDAWVGSSGNPAALSLAEAYVSSVDVAASVTTGEPSRVLSPSTLREGLLQAPADVGSGQAVGQLSAKASQLKKAAGPLWDKVLELCQEQRYLEAYKQVIAEPEETCLLRLIQHTGPIVERLDAESNSRLIRRLIHILSSPAKEPASSCIDQVFSWLWQALDVGIHFTSSQVEDLAAALQKVPASAQQGFRERAEAAQLLSRVQALRRG